MMQFDKYQEEASATFKPPRALTAEEARLLNWSLGLVNEAGELAGIIKHHIFHDAPLDKMLLAKEAGDVLWYLSALLKSAGILLGHAAYLNLAKLFHRHQGKTFSFKGSEVRKEREIEFSQTAEYRELRRLIERGDPRG